MVMTSAQCSTATVWYSSSKHHCLISFTNCIILWAITIINRKVYVFWKCSYFLELDYHDTKPERLNLTCSNDASSLLVIFYVCRNLKTLLMLFQNELISVHRPTSSVLTDPHVCKYQPQHEMWSSKKIKAGIQTQQPYYLRSFRIDMNEKHIN